MRQMRQNLRVFFVGGYLSYRALFNWMHWSYYIPTMLGAPIFQVLFFAYIGRYAKVRNDEFFVVGNAVQVCGGGTFASANLSVRYTNPTGMNWKNWP